MDSVTQSHVEAVYLCDSSKNFLIGGIIFSQRCVHTSNLSDTMLETTFTCTLVGVCFPFLKNKPVRLSTSLRKAVYSQNLAPFLESQGSETRHAPLETTAPNSPGWETEVTAGAFCLLMCRLLVAQTHAQTGTYGGACVRWTVIHTCYSPLAGVDALHRDASPSLLLSARPWGV